LPAGLQFSLLEPKTIDLVVAALHLADISTGELQSIQYGNAARLFPVWSPGSNRRSEARTANSSTYAIHKYDVSFGLACHK
jgi:hypothetical protein